MAVYTESELNAKDGLNLLDECVYVNEDDLSAKAKFIPIRENTSIDAFVINYTDLKELCESEDIDYTDAINEIAKENDLYPGLIAVAVSEETLVEYPDLVDEIPQVVVQPMSKNDAVGIYVEAVVDYCLENEQVDQFDDLLFSIFDESVSGKLGAALMAGGLGLNAYAGYKNNKLFKDMHNAGGEYGTKLGQFKIADRFDRQADIMNKGAVGGLMLTTGIGLTAANMLGSKIGPGLNKKLDKVYDEYKNKPNSVISKVIVKLNKASNKLQNKVTNAPDKQSNVIKRLIAKIKNVIAKLSSSIKR